MITEIEVRIVRDDIDHTYRIATDGPTATTLKSTDIATVIHWLDNFPLGEEDKQDVEDEGTKAIDPSLLDTDEVEVLAPGDDGSGGYEEDSENVDTTMNLNIPKSHWK